MGAGRRLFPPDGAATGLALLRAETTPGGLAIHEYAVAGPPEAGTYRRSGRTPGGAT
ncbi:MAG: hypothetical protein AB7O78_04775 [Thermoleophilia bacterium]